MCFHIYLSLSQEHTFFQQQCAQSGSTRAAHRAAQQQLPIITLWQESRVYSNCCAACRHWNLWKFSQPFATSAQFTHRGHLPFLVAWQFRIIASNSLRVQLLASGWQGDLTRSSLAAHTACARRGRRKEFAECQCDVTLAYSREQCKKTCRVPVCKFLP